MIKSLLIKLIKKPIIVAGLSVLVFGWGLFVYLEATKLQEAKDDIKTFISRWQYKLGENLHYERDPEFLKTIAEQLLDYPVSAYEVLKGDTLIMAWPDKSGIKEDFCKNKVESLLTLRGLHVGKIKSCISEGEIRKATIFSPLFTVVVVFATVLLFMVGFFPLFGYKTSLLRLARSVRDWNQNDEKEIKLYSNDKLTNEIIEMVQDGTDSRVELSEIKVELENEKTVSKATRRMAHDVTSPLASLKKLETEINELSSPLVSNIFNSAVDRIQGVVDEAFVEQNQYVQQDFEENSIKPIVDKIIAEKKRTLKEIQINSSISYKCSALFVPRKLSRILSNVITNAAESYEENPGEVYISEDSDEKFTTIKIKDLGKGISKKHLPMIFEENFSYGKKKGQGIGLSTAKMWVESWNGFIHVTSEEGKGTEVKIVLRNDIDIKENVQQEVTV